MKTTLKIITAAMLITTPVQAAGEFQMGLGTVLVLAPTDDKISHFGMGMATAGLTRKLGGNFWQSCAAALAVGVLKEVADKIGNGTSELNDALVTGAGCIWFTREF